MKTGVDSPLGPLVIEVENGAVVALEWGETSEGADDPVAALAVEELTAYFAGDLTVFSVPTAPRVGAFQARFLECLAEIPYGETRTYGEIAARLDVPPQAIGQACGANPIPIILPCHRVLGANGLGGYSGRGGIEAKVALLRLEGAAGLLI